MEPRSFFAGSVFHRDLRITVIFILKNLFKYRLEGRWYREIRFRRGYDFREGNTVEWLFAKGCQAWCVNYLGLILENYFAALWFFRADWKIKLCKCKCLLVNARLNCIFIFARLSGLNRYYILCKIENCIKNKIMNFTEFCIIHIMCLCIVAFSVDYNKIYNTYIATIDISKQLTMTECQQCNWLLNYSNIKEDLFGSPRKKKTNSAWRLSNNYPAKKIILPNNSENVHVIKIRKTNF